MLLYIQLLLMVPDSNGVLTSGPGECRPHTGATPESATAYCRASCGNAGLSARIGCAASPAAITATAPHRPATPLAIGAPRLSPRTADTSRDARPSLARWSNFVDESEARFGSVLQKCWAAAGFGFKGGKLDIVPECL
jgi:hypothetical protein